LPHHGDISSIGGNAPDYVKQLNYNTFHSYGVGDEDCFAHNVGKTVKFVQVNINRKLERQGRLEATTVAEVVVTKGMMRRPRHPALSQG
jgi:acyl-coenzyme A thioesterase 13